MKLTSSDIASIVNGRLSGPGELINTDVATDTRQLSFTEGIVFFALRGKNHDGHIFIKNLYKKGIRTFVVEKLPEEYDNWSDAAFIITADTITGSAASCIEPEITF